MAPLSEGDRAIIRDIAYEVADIVVKRYIRSLRWLLLGLAVGLSAGGCSLGMVIARAAFAF